MLGRDVVRRRGKADQTCDRGRVDDRSALALRQHLRDFMLQAKETPIRLTESIFATDDLAHLMQARAGRTVGAAEMPALL